MVDKRSGLSHAPAEGRGSGRFGRLAERWSELVSFYGMRPALPLFGLAFSMCWCYSSQRLAHDSLDGYFQILQYFGMAAASLACFLFARRTGRNLSCETRVLVGGSVLAVAVAPFVVLPGPWSASWPAMAAVAFLDGLAAGWMCIMWGAFYVRLGTRGSFACVCGMLAVASIVKVFYDLLGPDAVGTVALAALPVASVACLRAALRSDCAADDADAPSGGAPRFRRGTYASLRGMSVGVFVFVLGVAAFMSIGSGVFDLPYAFRVVSQVATLGIAAAMLVAAYRFPEAVSEPFSQWFLAIVVIATGLALGAITGSFLGWLSTAVFTTAQMLAIGFVWFAGSDVARNSGMPSDAVFGVGWGVMFSLPMGLGLLVPRAFGGVLDLNALSIVVLWLLLIAISFIYRRPSPELRLFVEFSPQVASEEVPAMRSRLDVLAERSELTPREIEVVALYAQGRNRAFIGSQLVISENTVRDHIKSAYRKLGIHNKQELIDLLG